MNARFLAVSLVAFTVAGSVGASPALAAAAPDPGAGKRAFTIEDFYRLSPVGAPALSPDGKTIVYALTTNDLPKAKRTVHLWRVDVDGGNGRPLTFADGKDDSPAFSPDGKWIGFVSTRSGDPQLYVLPVDGGEAIQKSHVPGGIGAFLFSPDGKHVAVTADVTPECGAAKECNQKLIDAKEKGKMKAHVADALLYRHWTDWKDGTRTHILVGDLFAEKESWRDATPGDFDSPVFSLGGAADFAFSPDGKELAFTSNRTGDEATTTNADLFTVRLDGTDKDLESPRNLTKSNAAWDGTPRYSPDGKSIVFRRQAVPRWESDRFRLARLDRATGTVTVLTESFDDTIGDFAFSKDGTRLYFTADVKGRTPLFELVLPGGKAREISSVGVLDGFAVSADARFAVVSRRRIGSPWELYRLDLPAGGEGTRLTRHNEAVEKEVDIRPADEIFVPGADGKPVQVFIVKPHGFDPGKKYPLILNVHGGPQQQWADSFRGDWQVYPGAGYVVAFPNPHGSTGFGEAYTASISGDWNGKVMTDVDKVAEALSKLPYVDANRMGAMGWSWGGYAMMWLEGHNTRFKALAAMMGVYDLTAMHGATEELWFPEWDLKGTPWENPDLYRAMSPSSYVKSYKTPCLVITGEKDYRVPYTQSLEFFTDLQKMKVPSRLVVFEKAGHWPSWFEMSLYYAAHLDWFHRYLGGAPSPWDPKELAKNTVFDKEEKK